MNIPAAPQPVLAGEEQAKYWTTAISEVHAEHVTVRGYDLDDLIGMPFSAATFLLIRGRMPSPPEAKVVDALLTGVLDYGLEKPGTVAARYAVSSNPSMVAGLATAALSAGEHSLATENAAAFIAQSHDSYVAAGRPEINTFAERLVRETKEEGVRIPGFGHPVFRREDPRAQKLRGIAEEAGLWGEPAKVYEAIHRAFVLNPKVAHFPINDVGVMAAIAIALGFSPKEATALSVIGTLPGIAAHVSEELSVRTPVRVIDKDSVSYRVPPRHLDRDLEELGWPESGRWV